MLIDLTQLCKQYSFTPSGIIHIGAHLGEESSKYQELGITNVVWVEANPVICEKLKTNVAHLHDNKVINSLISEVDGQTIPFYITNNGESSSLLQLDKHKIHHPHIHVTEEIKLETSTFKTICEKNNIDMSKYDFLNLDVQGAELLVLKGFGDELNNIEYIYTEVNQAHLYAGCALIDELDTYLKNYNFKRIVTRMTEYEWGDAFYIKIRK